MLRSFLCLSLWQQSSAHFQESHSKRDCGLEMSETLSRSGVSLRSAASSDKHFKITSDRFLPHPPSVLANYLRSTALYGFHCGLSIVPGSWEIRIFCFTLTRFLSISKASRYFWGPPSFLINKHQGLFSRSQNLTTDLMNECNITSAPPYAFMGCIGTSS